MALFATMPFEELAGLVVSDFGCVDLGHQLVGSSDIEDTTFAFLHHGLQQASTRHPNP